MIELEEKTKAMLKLIEEDADSFAKHAEMYYKKRPELISMVEEFYLSDMINLSLTLTTLASPFTSSKSQPEKLMSVVDQTYTKIRLSQRDASTRN